MVLKTNSYQESLLREKVKEILEDPGYSQADKTQMESVLNQLES